MSIANFEIKPVNRQRYPLPWKPAVPKTWLLWIAGMSWFGVGIWLCALAAGWLTPVVLARAGLLTLAGLLLAGLIYRFGFTRFAIRNLGRIEAMHPEMACVFAFQSWTSYPLVLVMISLGIFLRKYSPIPKPYLAVLYLGIGGGLLLSSSHYFKFLVSKSSIKS